MFEFICLCTCRYVSGLVSRASEKGECVCVFVSLQCMCMCGGGD